MKHLDDVPPTNRTGRRRRARLVAFTAAAAAAVVTISACSSSGDSGGSSGGSAASGGAADASLFPDKPATGSAIKIGVIYPEGGQTVNQPEDISAVKAVTEYANNNLGGIAGHKVELTVCKNPETPVGAQNCANQMVQAGVAAVLSVTSGFGDNMVPIITNAGIPYTSSISNSALETTTPGVFSWTGGFGGTLAGLAAYSKEKNYKNVAALTVNVPAAVGGAKAIGEPAFKAVGIGFTIIPINPASADVTPEVTAGLKNNPDAGVVIAGAAQCISSLQALQSINPSNFDTVVIQACLDPSVIKALPTALEGTSLLTTADPTSDDPTAQQYQAIMKKYAPDSTTAGYAVVAYQGMLGLVLAAQGLQGDPTPANVTTAIKAAKDVPLPAGDGIVFTCNGTAIPGTTACSKGTLIGPVKNNEGTDFKIYNQ